MADSVISVQGLRKSYEDLEAVKGIDLEVEKGEIFAFLGPNGAGKTTTVEILEGYRPRSAGEVSVLGIDPQTANRQWKNRVGFVLQESRLVPELTLERRSSSTPGTTPIRGTSTRPLTWSASATRRTSGLRSFPVASNDGSTWPLH